MNMIEIRNLIKKEKHCTLVIPEYTITKGMILGIAGKKYSGKDIFIKTISGFITPDSGSINSFSKTGFVPKGTFLYPFITPEEFIYFAGSEKGIKKNIVKARLEKASEYFDINRFSSIRINECSDEEITIIKFILASIDNPRVLIIEEFEHVFSFKNIRSFIEEFSKSGAVILSSDNNTCFENLCTDIVIMNNGHFSKVLNKKAISYAKEIHNKSLNEIITGYMRN